MIKNIKRIFFENKNQIKNNLIFIIFFLISYRYLILNTDLMFGKNWDSPFPLDHSIIYKDVANDFFIPNMSVFHNFNMWNFLSTFLEKIILISTTFNLISIIIFFFIIHLVAFNSISFFLKIFDQKITLFAGLFFSFNPYSFSLIVAGNIKGLIIFYLSPIMIYFLLNCLKKPCVKNILFALTLHFVFIGYSQFYVLVIILALVFYIFYTDQNLKKKLINFSICLFFFLISLIFLIPILQSSQKEISEIIDINFYSDHFNNSQNFFSLLFNIGFKDRNFFLNANTLYLPYLITYTFLIYYSLKFNKNDKFFKLIILSLIFIFFACSISTNIFPEIKIFLFKNIPLFLLYRSPQNLIFPIALMSIVILNFYFVKNKSRLLNIVFSILLIFPWLQNGDLGAKKMKKDTYNIGKVVFYNKDPHYIQTLKFLNFNTNDFDRIMFYPSTHSPQFLKSKYTDIAQSSIPEYLYLKNPIYLLEHVSNLTSEDFLLKNKIKYIVIRPDIEFFHNRISTKKNLSNISEIRKNILVKKFGKFEVYLNKNYNKIKPVQKCYYNNNDYNCSEILIDNKFKKISNKFYLLKSKKEKLDSFLINDEKMNILNITGVSKNYNYIIIDKNIYNLIIYFVFEFILLIFSLLVLRNYENKI